MALTKPSDDTVKIRRSDSVRETLGEWCIRNGLATAEEIDSCLKIQRDAELSGRVVPRLGEILLARGVLTQHQVAQALAAQRKEIRSCPRCGIQINVSVRGDAELYRCGRCLGPLAAPAGPPPLQAVDEDFILVSRDPVPAEVDSALRNPAAHFGKYILLKQIGQGGIGIVYLAWDTYLSQYVALKRLRTARPSSPQDTPSEHIHSLLKEARNSIRLRHPGVVSVFDVGRIGREYYVAMEYLEGETLAERILAARERGEPSPYYENPRETLSQMAEIARAVQYAHSRPSPIVHCDLKPANILIDRENHAHVLDFGLARNLELDKPERGEISGTPSYMAPEQASGESDKIDRRTDVYAFGAILYEMLTGRPPFVGGTIEVLGKTIVDVPDRPSEKLRSSQEDAPRDPSPKALLRVPPFLEDLCMRCLSKDRAERPQTMGDVATALESNFRPVEVLSPESTLRSPGQPKRLPPPARHIGLAAMAAALILGGGAWVHSRLVAPGEKESFEKRESEILRAMSKFQPGAARSLALRLQEETQGSTFESRASRLAEEATWVVRLQTHTTERLAGSPLDLPRLLLREQPTSAPVRVIGADPSGLRFVQEGRICSLPWERLEPASLVDLLLAALGQPEDADLLGLGILSLRIGLPKEANRCFDRLRTTSLGPIAERYQAGSNH